VQVEEWHSKENALQPLYPDWQLDDAVQARGGPRPSHREDLLSIWISISASISLDNGSKVRAFRGMRASISLDTLQRYEGFYLIRHPSEV
jgi:hypothetical protein